MKKLFALLFLLLPLALQAQEIRDMDIRVEVGRKTGGVGGGRR